MAEQNDSDVEQSTLECHEEEEEVEKLIEWARYIHLRVEWNLKCSIAVSDCKKFLKFYDMLTPERQQAFEAEVDRVTRQTKLQRFKISYRRRVVTRMCQGA
ncbi:protein UL30A [Saimiriine betaherpesvirus 4]|uniref:Protein UL30A n=1 Tax=Saimiriine betaherpesvirus 4 TaxID=1535247 RepID=G8XSU4_9BETA|nr:protein UL30A [Saimiriine betaherpesvirus 4]AEV80891.1 protein UL30A [Saimiriine betaherpesvirus 4]